MSPILIIAVSLLGAFFMTAAGAFLNKTHRETFGRFLALAIFLFNVVCAVFALRAAFSSAIVVFTGGGKPPFTINFVVDLPAAFLVLVVQVSFLLAVINGISSGDKRGSEFFILLILNAAGASGMIMTGDIFNLFVFMEITSISTCGLIAESKKKLSLAGSFKYILISSAASSLFLIAVLLLYGATGTLNIADLASKSSSLKSVAVISFLFIVASLFVESEIFPFNFWVPDSYEGARSEVSAVLAGIVSKAGLYALLRIGFALFGITTSNLFILFGIFTFLAAEFSALGQKNLKRMLVFSSIGQMGLILAVAGIGTQKSLYAAFFQMLTHSASKILLFLIAGYVFFSAGLSRLEEYAGFARKNRFLGALMFVAVASLVGFPFFMGFWSKLALLMESGRFSVLLLALILSGTLVEIFYYFRFLKIAYSGNSSALKISVSPFAASVFVLFAAAILLFGIFPREIIFVLKKSAAVFLDRVGYINAVLG